MEMHQLTYFESVSRHLHFTRAAAELNVAQPSVSQQIRKLEAELGAPLFHRMKRHVALTEAGKTFLPHARAVLQRLEEARLEVQELSGMQKGTLAVGAPPSVGTHLLPRALASFSRRHPGIALTFRPNAFAIAAVSMVCCALAGNVALSTRAVMTRVDGFLMMNLNLDRTRSAYYSTHN